MIRHHLALMAAAALAAVPSPAVADASLDRLAQEVERAESLRATLDLQRLFSQYAQFGLWDQAGALFAPDGEFRFDGLVGPEQSYRGPQDIAQFLRTRYGGGHDGLDDQSVSTMLVDAPVANLSSDGNSAKVRWEVLIFHGQNGAARVEGGVFENEYIRRGGKWLISIAHYYPEFDGSYETGWTNWGGGDLPVVPRHYTVDSAGVPVPPPTSVPPETNTSLRSLQARIDLLNDEDRVRNLQSALGYYLDRRMWSDVADLFSAHGVVEIGGQGIWRGRVGIERWLGSMGPAGLSHGQLNDLPQFDTTITVAPGGGEAWARGIELGLLGDADVEMGHWKISVFANRYVRENGIWKLRELRTFPLIKSDVFQGWGKSRIVDPAPTGDAAPDSPSPADGLARSGLAMPAFPDRHPVTGSAIAPTGALSIVAQRAITPPVRAAQTDPAPIAELRRRLARSTAFDGIQNVSSAYGHYIDDEDPAGFLGTLATNGFKGGRTGYYVTRASNFAARVNRPPPQIRPGVSYHWLTQPMLQISEDGRSAKGRFRLFQPRTGKTVGEAGDFLGAFLLESTYHNQYVLEDGVWRIWDLTVDPQYLTSVAFKDGLWAKAKDPPPRDPSATVLQTPSRGAPLDVTFEMLGLPRDSAQWPTIKPMWFGYTNPVSGRVPELYQPNCVPCIVRPDLHFQRNGFQQPPDAPEANRVDER